MNKRPDSGFLPDDIITILSELNALCAAHDAQRATRLTPTHYAAHARADVRPRGVSETGSIPETVTGPPPPVTNTQRPVTPPASLGSHTPQQTPSVAAMTTEHQTEREKSGSEGATTNTVFQPWQWFTAQREQRSPVLLRPRQSENQPISRRLRALESFYQSASVLFDTRRDNRQQGDEPRQNTGPKPVSDRNNVARVLFSEDILPRDDVDTQTAAPTIISTLPPPWRVLMLNSRDGAEYAWPVLYPAHWTNEEAMQRAKEAVSIVKAEDRLAVLDGETGISNYRHRLMDELSERGFIVTETDEGPIWD